MVYQRFIFELEAIDLPVDRGSGIFGPALKIERQAMDLNEAAGIRFVYAHKTKNHFGEFPVAITRYPTAAQIAKWPELIAWRDKVSPLYGPPLILWKRRDDLTQQVQRNIK